MIEAYAQMVAALVGVLCLIAILGRLAARRERGAELLRVLAYQSLGQKKGIAAVRAGGKVLLVAVTPTDVKLLASLDPAALGQRDVTQFGEVSAAVQILRNLKEKLHAAD